jgi:hypothetical protein
MRRSISSSVLGRGEDILAPRRNAAKSNHGRGVVLLAASRLGASIPFVALSLAILLFTPLPSVDAATEAFPAAKDTFVVSAFPNYNLGHLIRAEVGQRIGKSGEATAERGLLHFEVSALPAAAIVTDATLRLFIVHSDGPSPLGLDLTVQPLTAGFIEGDGSSGVTWNTQPAVESSAVAQATMKHARCRLVRGGSDGGVGGGATRRRSHQPLAPRGGHGGVGGRGPLVRLRDQRGGGREPGGASDRVRDPHTDADGYTHSASHLHPDPYAHPHPTAGEHGDRDPDGYADPDGPDGDLQSDRSRLLHLRAWDHAGGGKLERWVGVRERRGHGPGCRL